MRWIEVLSALFAAFGGLGVMFINFCLAMSLMDGFGVVLIVLLLFERGWVRAFVVPATGILGLITWMLLQPAPITLFAVTQFDGEYGPGTSPAGAPWRPDVTYVRVGILNDTNFDLTDADLTLSSDRSIVSLAQLSTLPDVVFHGDATKEEVNIGTIHVYDPSLSIQLNGHIVSIPLQQLATPQYRIICPRITKHSSADFIVAIATFDLDKSKVDKNLVIHSQELENGAHVKMPPNIILWEGPASSPPTDFAYDKIAPQYITVHGTYTAHFKPFDINMRQSLSSQQ